MFSLPSQFILPMLIAKDRQMIFCLIAKFLTVIHHQFRVVFLARIILPPLFIPDQIAPTAGRTQIIRGIRLIDHVDVRHIAKPLADFIGVVRGIQLIGDLPPPAVLKIIRAFLLQTDVPIKTVLASAMGKIILLFAEAAPQRRERRPHLRFRRIPRDDVDDAARSVRAIQGGSGTLQDLNALDRSHIGKLGHRHFAICTRTTVDIGPYPVDENDDMIRTVEHQAVGAVSFSRVPIDGNRYARHIPQRFLYAGIMPLLDHVSGDDIDIGVRLKGLYRRARCRDDNIIQGIFFYRLCLSPPRKTRSPQLPPSKGRL